MSLCVIFLLLLFVFIIVSAGFKFFCLSTGHCQNFWHYQKICCRVDIKYYLFFLMTKEKSFVSCLLDFIFIEVSINLSQSQSNFFLVVLFILREKWIPASRNLFTTIKGLLDYAIKIAATWVACKKLHARIARPFTLHIQHRAIFITVFR